MSVVDDRQSRRMLLGAGIGAFAAAVGSALGRPATVRATHGDVHLGGANTASNVTSISNNANTNGAISGTTSTDGIGVEGRSNGGRGVFGRSDSGIGVYGQSDSWVAMLGFSNTNVGVRGHSNSGQRASIIGHSAGHNTGVHGYSGPGVDPPPAKPTTGVYGESNVGDGGRGVWGHSNTGAGLYGDATTGHALWTSGRVRLNRVSGVASIPAGATSAKVTPAAATTVNSFVLLTPKANIGSRALWFTTDPATKTFTIRMSSSRAKVTPVAWLMIESISERASP
jgi:hypothetical protein